MGATCHEISKFFLKKEKGSPFEKEESALRVSRDTIPGRAASHMPPSKPGDLLSKPFESAHSDLGTCSPEKLFQKYITSVTTSQQNRPAWSDMFKLA